MTTRAGSSAATAVFVVGLVALAATAALGKGQAFVDGADGWHAIGPLQAIGIREALDGNFAWTDRLGIGYPLRNELNFQQLNPLNLLYVACEPLRAYHVQTIVWLALAALSAWLVLPRVFPSFGRTEACLYLAAVAFAPTYGYLVKYQVIFLSTFAIAPAIWLAARRSFERPGPAWLVAVAALLVLLAETQYNFTLVPNLVLTGLIFLLEAHRAGLRSWRTASVLALLGLVLAGVAAIFVVDALEILALSNRQKDLGQLASFRALLSRFEPGRVFGNLATIAEGAGVRKGHAALLVLSLQAWRRGRAEGGEPLLVALLSLALAAMGAACFDGPAHLPRMAFLCAFPASIATALAGGYVLRGLARCALATAGHAALALEVLAVPATLGVCVYAYAVAPWTYPPPAYGRTDEVSRFLDGLYSAAPPSDRAAYRSAIVVEDGFRYTAALFRRYPYQPSQAVFFGRRDTSYYGSYLIDGATTGRTWESRIACQSIPGFYGNYDALTESGVRDPLVRLLNVKYLVTPLELATPLATRIASAPAGDVLDAGQNLYRLASPLPIAWALPVPPAVAEALAGKPPAEASRAAERFLDTVLRDGTLDAGIEPLELERRGGTLELARGARGGGPRLVFISMSYWPGWEATQSGLARLHPFGFLAFFEPHELAPRLTIELRRRHGHEVAAGACVGLALLGAAVTRRARRSP